MGTRTKPSRVHSENLTPVAAAAAGAGAVLLGGAWAWSHFNQDGKPSQAPGHPGAEPRWYASDKSGVGTSVNSESYATSLVWFTIGHGILNEIFYPRVDWACTRDMGLIVTDGRDFFSTEEQHAEHRVEYPVEGVPLYRLINTCRQGRYRIEKLIFANPYQNAVIQRTRFTPLKGRLEDYHLYALLAPHLSNRGGENTAWIGDHKGIPALFAERGNHALALLCWPPWLKGSAGFVGTSDGWQDLSRHKVMTWEYERADGGNVALTGEVDLIGSGGEFVLGLGFGPNPAEAGHRALSSLYDDFDTLQAAYVEGWRHWQATLNEPKKVGKPKRDLFRISATVLRVHEDESIPGAIIASLSTPWGEVRGDEAEVGTGGYHLIWPRDLVEAAGGLLAAGASDNAVRVLSYLRAAQLADGHWPQNMWASSDPFWSGIQLGETAFPVLLLGLLRRDGVLDPKAVAQYWPMVRRAIAYIVRSGPSTQQDRWENEQGYTPYTLANVIAALLVAADVGDEQGESLISRYLRETADAWNSAIESWLYVKGTDLARQVGVEGYYVRIVPAGLDEKSTPSIGHVRLQANPPAKDGKVPITNVVSPDALAFVRYGMRRPDDPRILNTLKVIDAVNKVETPFGPCWHRYNGDRYGEHDDGSPYQGTNRGHGRAWPLLTGERAHYELMAGRRDEAVRLLHALEAFAGDGGLIPEQIWDSDDLPEQGLFKGRPSGSAMPLVWAHAEYIKLRRSLDDGRVFDLPPQTAQRYLSDGVGSDLVIWRFDHQRKVISPGERMRVEVRSPALVHWSTDGWKTALDVPTRDTGLGIHVADLSTESLRVGDRLVMTFRWLEANNRWEGTDFATEVIDGS